MKIAIITDQHFGARNDSVNFLEYYEDFYRNVFFPKLEEENISTVLILGDTFDRRKFINFYSLMKTKQMFFDILAEKKIFAYMLAGNHDTFFKNTNDVNSVDLLLKEYNNLEIIDSPTTININGYRICMIPWICPDNYKECLEEIKNTPSQICMGHFEIAGFSMYRGMPSHEGLSRDIFKKFDMTFSGHYHHKSNEDSIYYLGNPYALTWQDYGDDRGFHLFDLSTRELEFIKNPYEIFNRFVYDDKDKDASQISNIDMTQFANKYVKVIVENKTNPYLFDVFIGNLNQSNPLDISVVEDFSDLTEGIDDDIIDQAEDTLTILNKYIDNINDDNLDSSKMKSVFKELYVEALNLENV